MLHVSDKPTAVALLAIVVLVAQSVFAQPLSTFEAADGLRDPVGSPVEVSDPPATPVDEAASRVEIGEYLDAINLVELEIDKIERRSNRYNIELARPLVVLGDALAGVGDREGALGAYDRAVHVTRVNRGLHHPSQVEIVYREAVVLAANGQVRRANRRHEYAYDILLRNFGGDNPSLLPGIFSLADWYLGNYNIFSARSLYAHALSLADGALADDDPKRLRALRGVAATYRSERFPPYQRESKSSSSQYPTFRHGTMPMINNFAKGERALIEVVNTVKASDDASVEDLALAVLELADWYLVFEKHDRATTLYRHTWELLESNPDLLAETFDAPTPLYLPLPGNPEDDGVPAGRPRNGVVELSFRVDESGDVSGIATLHSEPRDLMDSKVKRAVRRARYRPAFDGKTTLATDDVRVSHEFVYFPDDDFPVDDQIPAKEPADTAQAPHSPARAFGNDQIVPAAASR
ncbi:MAG: TonB family protein [Gammaproteobacteria bacterium]|nr:TonB family protein [Gammaproteobacteria bacterium]